MLGYEELRGLLPEAWGTFSDDGYKFIYAWLKSNYLDLNREAWETYAQTHTIQEFSSCTDCVEAYKEFIDAYSACKKEAREVDQNPDYVQVYRWVTNWLLILKGDPKFIDNIICISHFPNIWIADNPGEPQGNSIILVKRQNKS